MHHCNPGDNMLVQLLILIIHLAHLQGMGCVWVRQRLHHIPMNEPLQLINEQTDTVSSKGSLCESTLTTH